jgi:membrane associated rhomboid family serine protease
VRSNSVGEVAQPLPRFTVVLIVAYVILMLLEALVSRHSFSLLLDSLGARCAMNMPADACDPGLPFNLALNQPSVGAMAALGGNIRVLSIAGGEWWRLLTSTLLHGGVTHLGFNSLATWNIGGQLEPRVGWRAILATFVLTGVLASLTSALVNPREIIGIGASGAIFGMLGFIVVWGVSSVPQFVQQIQRNAIMLVVVVGSSAFFPGVDNVAHIGGLLAGLLLGFVWERLSESVKTGLGISSAVALLAAFAMIVMQALPFLWR